MIMKKLKKLLHKTFRLTGREFMPYTYEFFYSPQRIKILKNENINLVFDIGAHNGLYGQELREDGYKGRIVSFEPLEKPFRELENRSNNDPLWNCEQFALGDTNGETEINVSGHLTSSSILSITEAHIDAYPSSDTVATELIKVCMLDSVRDKYIFEGDNVFMKVDVQGYEKHVLDGASEALKGIRLLEMELSLSEMYKGGPVMMEMLDILKDMGFDLVAINSVFVDPVSGYLLQADGIFINKNH